MSKAGLLGGVLRAAQMAGEKLVSTPGPGPDTDVTWKKDMTPVTQLDLDADRVIRKALGEIDASIPCLSEEDNADRLTAKDLPSRYWLVDPLDGTKEFLAGTKEFCVNIALMEGGRPIIGVVHDPHNQRTFAAELGLGAYLHRSLTDTPQKISTRCYAGKGPICLVSRHHAGREDSILKSLFANATIIPMGSALKFCCLAEGKADVYLRLAPLRGWDVAAGMLVLEEAGGRVLSADGEDLAPDATWRRINGLIAVGDGAMMGLLLEKTRDARA